MDDNSESEAYQSFLLRLWREGPAVWRYSLEDTRDRQRRGFASLEALVSFLLVRMEEGDDGKGNDGTIEYQRG